MTFRGIHSKPFHWFLFKLFIFYFRFLFILILRQLDLLLARNGREYHILVIVKIKIRSFTKCDLENRGVAMGGEIRGPALPPPIVNACNDDFVIWLVFTQTSDVKIFFYGLYQISVTDSALQSMKTFFCRFLMSDSTFSVVVWPPPPILN